MKFRVLSIGVVLFALWSCSGNSDANQQQVAMAPVQQQQVQAPPVDTTQAQAMDPTQAQAMDPAQAQAMDPAQTQAVNTQALPATITAFIKQHFPNATIVGIEPDRDHGGLEYDVYLSDGTQVDFDANNQWDQVECMRGVPAFFIPQGVANYVKSNFQNIAITKVNKEYHGYEIELANGMELTFDRSGRFMGMDD